MTGVETGTLIAGGLAAAGTAAEMAAARQQANRRRGILNEAFAMKNAKADKANDLVLDAGKDMAATNRLAEMQGQEDQNYLQSMTDLKGNGAGGDLINTAGDGGNVSAEFVKAKADRAIGETQRMTAMARELAKIRAPGQMITNQGLRRADAQERAGSIWGDASNMMDAYGQDAQAVQEPWYGNMGRLAKTAAMAYLGGV